MLLVMAVSCQKKDIIGVQKSNFPGVTEEVGKIQPFTIFNQEETKIRLVFPDTGTPAEYGEHIESFKQINRLSKGDNPYIARVYFSTVQAGEKGLVPSGEVSVILGPDTDMLNKLSYEAGIGYDFSPYKGYALLAISKKNDVFAIEKFLDDDVLGTMNGFVKWMNTCADKFRKAELKDGQPDPESLFGQWQGGYTFTFNLPDKEVAAVVCSDKDYINGNGTVDVAYSVTPLHAFDDQNGHGDYYIVNSSVAFNSAGMYKGNYKSWHGGVCVRICGCYGREFAINSYISDDSGSAIGVYAANAFPRPVTTTGSTSYTKGFSWNIGASLTGGISGEDVVFEPSISGGVSFNNSETRTISDVDIILNQSTNVANYVYRFNNLPDYDNLSITNPPLISVSTSTFEHSYIVYLDDVKDYSQAVHNINVEISELNYGACRFYSSYADFDNFTWGLDQMNNKSYTAGVSQQIPLPNRIPTGQVCITHDDISYGKYIYEIKATSTSNPEKSYDFTGSSYAKGDSFESYLPTDSYDVELSVGDTEGTVVKLKSSSPVAIKRCDTVNLNSGANFVKE